MKKCDIYSSTKSYRTSHQCYACLCCDDFWALQGLGSPGSFLKETFVYLVANIDLRFQLLQWLKPPGSPDAATAGDWNRAISLHYGKGYQMFSPLDGQTSAKLTDEMVQQIVSPNDAGITVDDKDRADAYDLLNENWCEKIAQYKDELKPLFLQLSSIILCSGVIERLIFCVINGLSTRELRSYATVKQDLPVRVLATHFRETSVFEDATAFFKANMHGVLRIGNCLIDGLYSKTDDALRVTVVRFRRFTTLAHTCLVIDPNMVANFASDQPGGAVVGSHFCFDSVARGKIAACIVAKPKAKLYHTLFHNCLHLTTRLVECLDSQSQLLSTLKSAEYQSLQKKLASHEYVDKNNDKYRGGVFVFNDQVYEQTRDGAQQFVDACKDHHADFQTDSSASSGTNYHLILAKAQVRAWQLKRAPSGASPSTADNDIGKILFTLFGDVTK